MPDINYPPVGFYFSLNLPGDSEEAIFQEVSGLSNELEREEVTEGGENRFKHKIPTITKYSNLVLKRGMISHNTILAAWCKSCIEADFAKPIVTKELTINLLDNTAKKLMSWQFHNAWPVKWSISDLNLSDGGIAIETLEFAYNYFTRNPTPQK